MNQDTISIALTQLFSPFTLGLILIFLTPIVFGAITSYYSWKLVNDWEKERDHNGSSK